jgi:hypothetical protein
MGRNRESLHVAIAALYRDGAPKILEHIERAHGDAGQAVVWLVGLASTLLVLAVANPDKVAAIAGPDYVALCGLLLTTVASGVLCRLVALWGLAFGRGVMFNLGAHMAGYVAGYGLEEPDDLSHRWDEQEIVRRLRDDFGSDYTFLLEHRVPLAGCREAYQGAHDLWKRQQAGGTESMANILAAHFGLSEKKANTLFQSTDLASIRRKAYLFKGLSIAAGVLLVLASASFVAAMYVVARGLARLASA